MKTFEVIKDTLVVENNTADNLRVTVITEKPVVDEFVCADGTIVRGGLMSIITKEETTLGGIKARIASVPARRALLQRELAKLEEIEADAITLLGDITTAVDEAIDEIIASPGGEDRRTI